MSHCSETFHLPGVIHKHSNVDVMGVISAQYNCCCVVGQDLVQGLVSAGTPTHLLAPKNDCKDYLRRRDSRHPPLQSKLHLISVLFALVSH